MNSSQILKNTYKIIKKIGAGSYGEVFLVENLLNQEKQVVKKSTVEKISNFKEAEFLLSLDHPNIAKAYDVFVEGKEVCIVMKFYENGTVLQQIQQKQNLDSQYLKWAAQLISAINYIHSKNLLHRDIKLENLFLDENFDLVVGDFGVSKDLNASLAKTFIGTPQHMSPEIFDNIPYSFASDVWAIGCALYHLIEKKFPFTGSLPKIMQMVEKVEYNEIKNTQQTQICTLIKLMLIHDPALRITLFEAAQLLSDTFQQYNLPKPIEITTQSQPLLQNTVVTSLENQVATQLKLLKEAKSQTSILSLTINKLISLTNDEQTAYNMILAYLFAMKNVNLTEICTLVNIDPNKLVPPQLAWETDPQTSYLNLQSFFEALYYQMTGLENVETLLQLVKALVLGNQFQ